MIKLISENGTLEMDAEGTLPVILADHATITKAIIEGITEDKPGEERNHAIDIIIDTMHDSLDKMAEMLKGKEKSVDITGVAGDLRGIANTLRKASDTLKSIVNADDED